MASLRFPNPNLCFLHLFLFYFASYCSSLVPLCNHDQSSALLHFKSSFKINASASDYKPSHPKTASWQNGTNCCLWDGVTCDTISGHVIGLDLSSSWLYGKFHPNSTLFQLVHLQRLNLADNNFLLSPISSQFGELVTLKHLNLSFSVFVGEIPSKISQLSKLISLDFSGNYELRVEPFAWKKLIQNVTNLRELNLNDVNMSSIRPASLSLLTNLSSSLVFIYLSGTQLQTKLLNDMLCLPNLRELDLSWNNFQGSNIPLSFWNLTQLTYLRLQYSNFSGEISSLLSNLQCLTYLDLSRNNLSGKIPPLHSNLQHLTFLDHSVNHFIGEISSLVSNFQNLNHLDLSMNTFNGEIPSLLSNLQSLTYLDLSENNLSGKIPPLHSNLQHLTFLDLSANNFIGEISSLVSNFQHLNHLDLSINNFSGEIPSLLSNLHQLSYLDLSWNNFSGQIPDNFSLLKQLTVFDIRGNNLGGQLPASLFGLTQLSSVDCSKNKLIGPVPQNISKFSNLQFLDLSYNSLNGTIPPWCFSISSLLSLGLCGNQFTGNIAEFSSYSMTHVELCNNKLQGNIPTSMFDLVNLTSLSLSSNNLSGLIQFQKFSKLENLELIRISSNNFLSFNFNDSADYSLPNLRLLDLSSHKIYHFPKFLAQLPKLDFLHLSKTNIHGSIPSWFKHIGNGSLYYLDLSHNFLTSVEHLPWRNMQFIDLSSNMLTGDISSAICNASSLRIINLSHNNLTGIIPHCLGNFPSLVVLDLQMNNFVTCDIRSTICNASSLSVLNLSHNNLTGVIPRCLGTVPSLAILDLQMNKFHGSIPRNICKRNILQAVKLNGNKLAGPLPHSLAECKKLELLDVGDNNLEDIFPSWLEVLPELQVLILRANKFHGIVAPFKSKHPFPKLRIFDISSNHLRGTLPTKYMEEFQGMMNASDGTTGLQYIGSEKFPSYYNFSVVVRIKGSNIEMERILISWTIIDFSNNRFEGEIPAIIGKLHSLKELNLSHNKMAGNIPQCLGNLTNLESLDLSSNKLTGQIPLALTNLDSLSLLNVSYNQLGGMIPEGKQFNTFSNDSYEGNSGLCGFPLSKKCVKDGDAKLPSPFINHHKEEFGFGWKAVAMGYGCGMAFGLVIGCIVFSTGKPQWLVRIVEGEQVKQVKRTRKRAQTNRRRTNASAEIA